MSVYSEVDPLPEGMPIVQVGWSTGISPRITAPRSAEGRCGRKPACAGAGAEGRRWCRAAKPRQTGHHGAGLKNWTKKRKTLVEQISKAKGRSPIDPDRLALQV
jgi:benzoylformate decarboxylase